MNNVEKIKILIVDDQIINIKLLSGILKNEDYDIVYAIDGYEGIKKVKSDNPYLILLDVEMPGLTGYQVCDLLRQDPETSDIPIIFLTSKSSQEDIIEGFKHGGVDYVTRPFNKEEIKARIKTHLELKKSKELTKLHNRELEQLNAEKDKLFSIISHDIRSAFAGMYGFIELLHLNSDLSDTERLKNLISKAFASSNRLNNLLNDLLQWSRFQMKNYHMKKHSFYLKDLINEVIETYYDHIEQKEISVNLDIPKEFKIYADYNMIKTLIRNLLSNAIKFSYRTNKIDISASENNDYHIVSIRDYGAGIEPSKQENLFKLNKVYSTKGTEKEIGTGLGLILCKELANKHNGNIWFKSELNQGTNFYFSIPKNISKEEG